MKKILFGIFSIFILTSCLLFVGCGTKYGNLVISVAPVYSTESVKQLSNGNKRVSNKNGVFDINRDGSYTLYLSSDIKSRIDFNVTYTGAPGDFTYDSKHKITNEIISITKTKISSGYKFSLTAESKGQAILTFTSAEGDKSFDVHINVVEVPDEIYFASDNCAITNDSNSSINVLDILNGTTGFASSFSFGQMSGEDFVAYSQNQLLTEHNLNYNPNTNVLSIVGAGTDLESLVIEGSCDDPLGKNLTARTNLFIVNALTDFEIYRGSQLSDVVSNNLVQSNDVQEFISNYTSLNYCDLVFKVNNHGQAVEFSLENNLVTSLSRGTYLYTNFVGGVEQAVEIENSATCYYFARLISISSTEASNYVGHMYNVKFLCNYKDYEVSGYPMESLMKIKSYEVVKNYSIDGVKMPSVDLTSTINESNYASKNIYVNVDSRMNGTSIDIGVSEPTSLVGVHSDFKLAFYVFNSDSVKVQLDASNFVVSIQRGDGEAHRISDLSYDSVLPANSRIYVKLADDYSPDINMSTPFFAVLTATEPSNNALKATAVIKFIVAEGISSVDSLSCTFSDGAPNLLTDFDDAYVSSEVVNLNYNTLSTASVTLSYSQADATTDNIYVRSSDENIVRIEQDGTHKYKFAIVPVSVGACDVVIGSTNLSRTYTLRVNVYEPISNLHVSLKSFNSNMLDYSLALDSNVQEIIAVANREIALNVTILPASAAKYSITYTLLKKVDGDYSDFENNSITFSYEEYLSKTKEAYQIKDGNKFLLDCYSNSFKYLDANDVSGEYKIKISVQNLNLETFESEFQVYCFIPTSRLNISTTTLSLYNPNTLSYFAKSQDENIFEDGQVFDKSIIGVKVDQLSTIAGTDATYNFLNYGEILFTINGVTRAYFTIENEYLVNCLDNIVIPVVNRAINGYYWFRLNRNFDYSLIQGKMVVEARLKEHLLSSYSQISHTASVSILNAEKVSSIYTSESKEVYFTTGMTGNQNISLFVAKDSAYNKNINYELYTILKVGGKTYYALSDASVNSSSNSSVASVSVERKLNQYELTLSQTGFGGNALLVVYPQDRVVSQEDYDLTTNYTIQKVTFGSEDDFAYNVFYIKDGDNYVLADSCVVGQDYYIYAVGTKDIISSFGALVINISVADGEKYAYHISDMSELISLINNNTEGATKNYVLTNNIVYDGNSFEVLGGYYKLQNTGDTFPQGAVAVKEGNEFLPLSAEYDETKEYYGFGFNGSLSGKYDISNGVTNVSRYSTISGLKYNGSSTTATYIGLFASLGPQAFVHDLTISYSGYQVEKTSGNMVFGGLAGRNYGQVQNVDVTFAKSSLGKVFLLSAQASASLTFGGLVGENYGTIINDENDKCIRGEVVLSIAGADIYYGGVCGKNSGSLTGNFDYKQELTSLILNNSGFSTSLKIEIRGTANNSAIGGAVGYNSGVMKNVATSGEILATNFNCVGGLAGQVSDTFVSASDYSVSDSYSICSVKGKEYVGGAFGKIDGNAPRFYYVSAENYVDDEDCQSVSLSGVQSRRAFVYGKNYVGGFAGEILRANLQYCYATSYYGLTQTLQEDSASLNYDIIAFDDNAKVGGFASRVYNSTLTSCATKLNVYGKNSSTISLFVADNDVANNSSDIYAFGHVSSQSNNDDWTKTFIVSTSNYTIVCEGDVTKYYVGANESNQTEFDSSLGSQISSSSAWGVTSGINDNLPYLIYSFVYTDSYGEHIQNQPLVSFEQTFFTITLNDGDDYSYVKVDDNSLALFISVDESGNIDSNIMSLLNNINLFDVGALNCANIPTSYKTAQAIITSSNEEVLSINYDGSVSLNNTGVATLTIASKLNPTFKKTIIVYVINGLSQARLYTNVALSNELENKTINIQTSHQDNLFIESTYTRILPDDSEANFKNYNNVGIKFSVEKTQALLDDMSALSESDLGKIFKINSSSWDTEGTACFVNILGSDIKIDAYKKLDHDITISYQPFISITDSMSTNINVFVGEEKSFVLHIYNGSTNIKFNDNNFGVYVINQNQTIVFTISIDTDDEFDDIESNADSFMQIGSEIDPSKDSNFHLNSSRKVTTGDGKIIVSRTYTFQYKDKVNSISESNSPFYDETTKQIIYILPDGTPLCFYPKSNPNVGTKQVYITINSKDSVEDLSAKVYSDIWTDYPQKENTNNVIYSGNMALLAVDTYPFFANYTKLRVSYRGQSSYPMIITQLQYNANSAQGTQFSAYSSAGVEYINQKEYLIVDKSSGQDVFASTDDNVYSYGRTYFFSMLIGSATPSNTNYVVVVEVLDKNGIVINTCEVELTTLIKPELKLSFDDAYKGNDDIYYLPYNTLNKLNVSMINTTSDVGWSVVFDDMKYNGPEYSNIRNALIPQYINGNYYVQVMKYVSKGNASNVDETSVIGKKVTIKGVVQNEDLQSEEVSVTFVITMFSVTDIKILGSDNDELVLQASSISPLKVSLSAYYDTSLDSSSDTWYSHWFNEISNTSDGNYLKGIITNSGYTLSDSFTSYRAQLENMIAKSMYEISSSSANPGIYSYTSNVFAYVTSPDRSNYQLLKSGASFDDNHFNVEMYDGYFVLVCDRLDKTYSLKFNPSIDYAIENTCAGLPTIRTATAGTKLDGAYVGTFSEFTKYYTLRFSYYAEFLNPIPVSNVEEFLSMQKGLNYRLVNDIVLSDYTPIVAEMASFDGNGYTIYITSFAIDENTKGSVYAGLFSSISSECVVYNVTIHFASSVTQSFVPSQDAVLLSPLSATTFVFGGLTAQNDGIVTNCFVTGKVEIELNLNSSSTHPTAISSSMCAGLVGENSASGTITNSKVYDFALVCMGEAGGFVGNNQGRIIASFFDESSIYVRSSANVGGFVNTNSGEIFECYSQGKRDESDGNLIQNTGDGVTSDGGVAAGFVYNNTGSISDCYSNTRFRSSLRIAGFVYVDSSSSKISRCYSISSKDPNDNNTTAFPFLGPISGTTRVEVAGELNDCFYLYAGNYIYKDFYISGSNNANETPENKKAKYLVQTDFAAHANFTNYDLSLVSETITEGDHTSIIADGYTWVIANGKPMLVATLTDTFSNQKYLGKQKTIKNSQVFIGLGEDQIVVSGDNGKYYYLPTGTTEVPVSAIPVYTMNKSDSTLTYTIPSPAGSGLEDIIIVYSYTMEGEPLQIKLGNIVKCEFADGVVLDWRECDIELNEISSDKNFRAGDTIEIIRDKNGDIYKVTFEETDQVQYAYEVTTGTRINPKLIFSYDSFCYEFTKQPSTKQYYRLLSDIDLGMNFVNTSYCTFAGVLQGNHMSVKNIYLSYTNTDSSSQTNRSFGLFANITGEIITHSDNEVHYTPIESVISNLELNVSHVVSHSHDFVGALAGQIYTGQDGKVFLNNISISSASDATGVFGVHATGGLAGLVRGNVIMKDISVSVNATSFYEQPNTETHTMLYINKQSNLSLIPVDSYVYDSENNVFKWIYPLDVSTISYTGGIVGIMDTNAVVDKSTKQNYNATNVSVSGKHRYTGSIVGSMFGLVGENAVVNYANVVAPVDASDSLVVLSYGGGIVGENRGIIQNSSATYADELSSSVDVLSPYSTNNYFYNLRTNTSIAIGGIAGLNNGGKIENCLTTINVRNQYSKIAGGAVGRMVCGTLSYVISSGAVLGGSITGGLVGALVDSDKMSNAGGYSSLAVVDSEEESKIEFCVAASKYFASDYNYYKTILSGTSKMIAGFVGLIVTSDNVGVGNDYTSFGKNYYVNTLYNSSSTTPSCYIDVAFESDTFDDSQRDAGAPVIIDDVVPYSLKEMFYDEDYTYNSSTQVSYTMNLSRNDSTIPEGVNPEDTENEQKELVYSIISANPNYIKDYDAFYTNLTNNQATASYDTLYACYGDIYYKENGAYVKIQDEGGQTAAQICASHALLSGEYSGLYYVANNKISDFEFSKTYSITGNVRSNLDYNSGNRVLFVDNNVARNSYESVPQTLVVNDALDSSKLADGVYEVTGNLNPRIRTNQSSKPRIYLEQSGRYYVALTQDSVYYTNAEGSKIFVAYSNQVSFDYSTYASTEFVDEFNLFELTPDFTAYMEESIAGEKVVALAYNTGNGKIYVYPGDFDTTSLGESYKVLSATNNISPSYNTSFASKINSTNSVVVNGVKYDVSSAVVLYNIANKTAYFYSNYNGSSFENIELDYIVDKVKITGMSFVWEEITTPGGSGATFNVKSIKLTYACNDINLSSDSPQDSVSLVEDRSNPSRPKYTLSFFARSEIFTRFYNNGSWSFGANFFTSGSSQTNRYPTNKAISEVYLWRDFATQTSTIIYEIESAEDLAAFANSVNSGTDYNGATIKLKKDIDLSGKYWTPIGSNVNPFRGTFDGNNKSIKYMSVNETSNNGNMLDYVGLFAYAESATFTNLTIIGSEISGYCAGSVVGFAEGCTFKNIVCKNSVTGALYAGGVAGVIKDYVNETTSVTKHSLIQNVINYGSVTLKTQNASLQKYFELLEIDTAQESNIVDSVIVQESSIGSAMTTTEQAHIIRAYVGGIAGDTRNTLVIEYTAEEKALIATGYKVSETFVSNYGLISVKDSKTSYEVTGRKYVELYVGGIFGHSLDNTYEVALTNYGVKSIATNAHRLFVGGVIGKLVNQRVYVFDIDSGKNVRVDALYSFANDGKGSMSVEYRNSCVDENISTTSYIGGVIAFSTSPISYFKNEADITFNQINHCSQNIVIGGVLGEGFPDNAQTDLYPSVTSTEEQKNNYTIDQCFNAGDINISSVGSETKYYVGGVLGGANMHSVNVVKTATSSYEDVNSFDVSNCYNSGKIYSATNGNLYMGGIVGTFYYRRGDERTSSRIGPEAGLDESLLENNKFAIYNTINVGTISTQSYSTKHEVGAIVAVSAQNQAQLDVDKAFTTTTSGVVNTNLYLKGSDSNLDTTEKSSVQQFASDRTSEELKTDPLLGFDTNIWQHSYVSWYYTLKNNSTSILWLDKQSIVNITDGYYLIDSPEQLSYIASRVNNGSLNSANVKIKLISSIDLAGRYWTPIGTEQFPFKGTFDGGANDRYVIKNLTIDGEQANTDLNYGGLFGYIQDATITNIGVESPIVKNVDYASAIVFSATNSLISQVYVDSDLHSGSVISGLQEAGGIATKLINSSGAKGIEKSYNNVQVEISSYSTKSNTIVGGLVAVLDNSSISNSYNNYYGAVVTKEDSALDSVLIIGSIVGDSCRVNNVFSLARKFNEADSIPKLFVLNNGELTSTQTPTFENLSGNYYELNQIWLSGYSLNDSLGYADDSVGRANDYPSLRGMYRSWSNYVSDELTIFQRGEFMSADDFYAVTRASLQNFNSTSVSVEDVVAFGSQMLGLTNVNKICPIRNAEDLALFAYKVNNGDSTENTEYILLSDIDLSGKYWTPIGINETTAFKGVFNFNGHVICGLTIDTTLMQSAGLFGYTSGAYILNGYIDRAFVRIQNELSMTQNYVGALVGLANNTSIMNIAVNALVSSFTRSTAYVGGLAGTLIGNNRFTIENITINQIEDINHSLGGVDLMGYDSYVKQSVPTGNSEVENNNIQIFALSTGSKVYVGGLAGLIEGYIPSHEGNPTKVSYVSSYANIAGISLSSSNVYVGGIFGCGSKQVVATACKSSGQLKAYSQSLDMVGGIVGYFEDGTLDNCLFDGYLEGRLRTYSGSSYWSYVGGIAGVMADGVIRHCVNTGRTFSSYKTRDVSLGGIIGYATSVSGDRRDFSNDGINIYSDSATGFFATSTTGATLGSVGIYDDDNMFQADIESYRNTIVYNSESGTGVMSSNLNDLTIDNGFNGDGSTQCWDLENKTLKSSLVYIVGGDSPFKIVGNASANLLTGIYVEVEALDNIKFASETERKCYVLTSYTTYESGELKTTDNIISAEKTINNASNESFLSYVTSMSNRNIVIILSYVNKSTD